MSRSGCSERRGLAVINTGVGVLIHRGFLRALSLLLHRKASRGPVDTPSPMSAHAALRADASAHAANGSWAGRGLAAGSVSLM
jgi:hypothetical protein